MQPEPCVADIIENVFYKPPDLLCFEYCFYCLLCFKNNENYQIIHDRQVTPDKSLKTLRKGVSFPKDGNVDILNCNVVPVRNAQYPD